MRVVKRPLDYRSFDFTGLETDRKTENDKNRMQIVQECAVLPGQLSNSSEANA